MEYTPPFYPGMSFNMTTNSTVKNRDRQFKVKDPSPTIKANLHIQTSARFMNTTFGESGFSTFNQDMGKTET